MSQKDDVVICWSATTGILFNFFSYLMGNKRYIISMNWLTPHKGRKKSSLKKLLMSNKKSSIVVNSPISIDEWKEALQLETTDNFHFIPDVYNSKIAFENILEKEQKYCFTGGMNNRDWSLLVNIARECQDIKFVCVALEEDFTNDVTTIPSNMTVYYSLDVDAYYNLMRNAYLVLLPLKDQRVGGLINIIRGAQYGVLCCVSKTPSTELYYAKENSDLLLETKMDIWVDKIHEIYSLEFNEYKNITENFQNYIRYEFSPKRAVEKIFDIISDVWE